MARARPVAVAPGWRGPRRRALPRGGLLHPAPPAAGAHPPGARRLRPSPGLPLRLHAPGGPDPGLGDRAGPRGARRSRGARAPDAPLAGPEPESRLPRRLPRLRAPRAGAGALVGRPPRQRAEVPAHGGGARARRHARRRGRERGDGGPGHEAPGVGRRPGRGLSRPGVGAHGRRGPQRRGGPGRDPGHPHREADGPGEGGRRLLRPRPGAVADAGADPEAGPGAQPGARGSRGGWR